MKIASWNVNSLRAREDQVLDWLEAHQPDVLCLQETKVTDQEFPEDALGDINYDVAFLGQPAYNGVAIATQSELQDVTKGLPGDPSDTECRLIAATLEDIRIINVYIPNGMALDSEKFEYKIKWLQRLLRFVEQSLQNHKHLLLCGDFNIAPQDIDVWNPDGMRDGLFVSPQERQIFGALLELGLVDTFRHQHPSTQAFSWWDYRGGGFERNRGMRIDHVLVTPTLLTRQVGIEIDRATRGEESPSDHAPVILTLGD